MSTGPSLKQFSKKYQIGAIVTSTLTKSPEELAEDGLGAGNRKLVPVVARHGAGLDDGDYINISMKGDISKISEGLTRNELKKGNKKQDQGFIVDENDNEQIPFAT